MEEAQVQAAFQQLRPICVTLTKEHDIAHVQNLHEGLNRLPSHCQQALQEYVLFPLRVILKQGKSRKEDLYCHVAYCMCTLLENTTVKSVDLFRDLFDSLCLLISVKQNAVQVPDVSEEYKIAVVKTLSALLKSADVSVVDEMYQPRFLPALGHTITLMLQMADKEKNRELRMLAIMCLLHTAQIHHHSHHLVGRMSSMFASFLPGISLGLSRIITGDTKQGHKITVASIEVWYKIVSLVMNDKHLTAQQPIHTPSTDPQMGRYQSLLVERSETWVKSTAEKIQLLTQKIKTLQSHSNWRVRLAMVEWASCLLNTSTKSLAPSIPDCLEVLVSLVGDEYPNVARKSQTALTEVRTKEEALGRTLLDILEENLHTLAMQMPRLIRTAAEEEKLTTLKLFNGYLQLLGSDINSLLSSSAHLTRLGQALMQVLELDCSSVKIIQEKTLGERFSTLDTGQLYCSPRKYFKHFTDENIYRQLISTCKMLGHYGSIDVLFDHFLDLFHQSSLNRKQAVLTLNHICEGIIDMDSDLKDSKPTVQREKEDLEQLIRSLLDVYLDPEHLNLVTSVEKDDISVLVQSQDKLSLQVLSSTTNSASLLEMNSNIVQTCLILEGIAICVKVLGKDHEHLMMEVLYPVLEKVGHENAAISHTAFLTLSSITQTCKYCTIQDLLQKNADYLVNSISLRMRHLDRNPQAPHVLSVILSHSSSEMLPLLEDTIREIMEALDSYYEDVGLLFMRVLHTLTIAIHRWFPADNKPDHALPVTAASKHTPSSTTQVISFIRDYLKQKEISESGEYEGDLDHEEVTEGEGQEDNIEYMDEDEQPEVPYHVKKVKQILGKCIHLLAAEQVKVRLVTLDTVAQGLMVLQPYQNELLPLVHKLWPPFTQRLIDKDMLVMLKACSVLHIFAEVSRDFIRQRVVKDVFPLLIQYLNKQAKTSAKAVPIYHQTLACKLQSHILHDVGDLCYLVGLGENHLSDIIRSCLPYLSCKQPQVLQHACLDAFKSFCQVEPDTVWFLLNNLYSPQTYEQPQPTFSPIKFQGGSQRNEFSDNVEVILKYM